MKRTIQILNQHLISKVKFGTSNINLFKISEFSFGAKKKLPQAVKVIPEEVPSKKSKKIIQSEEVMIEEDEVVDGKLQPKKKGAKKVSSNKKEKIKAEEADNEEAEVETVEESPKNKIKSKLAKSPSEKLPEVTSKKSKSIVSNNLNIKDITQTPEKIGKLPLTTPFNLYAFPHTTGTIDPYEEYIKSNRLSLESKNIIAADHKYNCKNYAPLPVVLHQGNGAYVQDIDGYNYIDCLMGYSAVNLGHKNPNIEKAMISQMQSIYMTSRAFYNNRLYEGAHLLSQIFGKEKCVFMNSGAEAGETAVKFARRWGYRVKKIPENQAKVVFAEGNFWGRTITACGTTYDQSRRKDFGPYDELSFYQVPYNNVQALAELFAKDGNICAFMVEPIQGESGVIIPDNDYLKKVRQLCNEHKVLLIVDEIQSGLGRSGQLLASHWSLQNEQADLILLAKSLTNGYYPVSAVLGNSDIIDQVGPGEHGSTFSANPLAMSALIAALTELVSNNKKAIVNSFEKGGELCYMLLAIQSPLIKEIRGRGLFIGVEFHHDLPIKVSDIALMLMERGLLTKQTHAHCIRICPPINSTPDVIFAIYSIFKFVLNGVQSQLHYKPKIETVTNFICSKQAQDRIRNMVLNPHDLTYNAKNPMHEEFSKSISVVSNSYCFNNNVLIPDNLSQVITPINSHSNNQESSQVNQTNQNQTQSNIFPDPIQDLGKIAQNSNQNNNILNQINKKI